MVKYVLVKTSLLKVEISMQREHAKHAQREASKARVQEKTLA